MYVYISTHPSPSRVRYICMHLSLLEDTRKLSALSARKNPLIAPKVNSQYACVNIYPAGKLHHGGERPCARSKRQATQTYIR